jgi:hypothetical protein
LESQEKIKQKYYDIIPRSFSTKLELYLFSKCHINWRIGSFAPWELIHFRINDDLVTDYLISLTLGNEGRIRDHGLTMQKIDEMIEAWLKENSIFKTELFELYKLHFITDLFPFSEFEAIYDVNPEKRICHYCQISDEEIELLEVKGQIKTKRDRGYTMEIDRIKPNHEYTKDNVVLACYWCNNAKSDEFSETEFYEHIGPGIGEVWKLRKNIQ